MGICDIDVYRKIPTFATSTISHYGYNVVKVRFHSNGYLFHLSI